MKLYNIKAMIPAVALLFTASVTSCMSDLDDGNIDPNAQSQVDIAALYSKCYACLILEGNDGNPDFTSNDAGKTTLIRNIYNANVLSTDEAICWWTDGGLEDYGVNQPTPGSDAIRFL